MDKAIKLFLYLVIPTFAGVFNVVGDLMNHGAAAQIELNATMFHLVASSPLSGWRRRNRILRSHLSHTQFSLLL